MSKHELPITEELDFAYLLELMPALKDVPEYSWLPELFSIIGHEKLLKLCRYAGGEIIKIPTVDELNLAIQALQWFYNIVILKSHSILEVPFEVQPLLTKILEVYNVTSDTINN